VQQRSDVMFPKKRISRQASLARNQANFRGGVRPCGSETGEGSQAQQGYCVAEKTNSAPDFFSTETSQRGEHVPMVQNQTADGLQATSNGWQVQQRYNLNVSMLVRLLVGCRISTAEAHLGPWP
jgi:hypothetical protein